MKFSIIVPSFNQGRFLKECIDSILSQKTDNDLEVFVYDAGSQDESVEILESYGDQISWFSENDRGQAHAINKGLKLANGDIVAYLNSDDIYYRNAFTHVREHFETYPNATALYGKAHHLYENGDIMENYYTEPWDYEKLKFICYLCQPAVFWKRSLLKEFGYFNESLHFCLDYEYWLRIGKKHKFNYLDKHYLAGSRFHDDTKTLSNRVKSHLETAKMLYNYGFNEGSIHWLKNAAYYYKIENDSPDVEIEKVMFQLNPDLLSSILNIE
jgi:glycosyltransferase involved in cell wall biosynthesis